MWIHSIYRATRWTICWPPTSVRCCPQWTNTLAGATTSDLPIGRRQMSSSGFCALLVSTAAGDVPTPTSCGGWVALVLIAQKNQCSLWKVRLQAAVTPVKVQANLTILTTTWMRMSKVMRMTISDTPSDRLVVLTLGFCSVYSQNVYLTWIVEIKLFYSLFYSLLFFCFYAFCHFIELDKMLWYFNCISSPAWSKYLFLLINNCSAYKLCESILLTPWSTL